MARTDTLANFVTDIANAIRNKSGKTELISPSNFDIEIENLSSSNEGDGALSVYSPRYISFYMYTGEYLTEELSVLDTSKITSFKSMFHDCSSLKELDLSKFNTSNVTTMYNMFYGCSSLKSLDVSNFNTSKCETFSYMFRNVRNITSLDISNFDTTNAKYLGSMFYQCQGLTELDLSNFYTPKVTDVSYMFMQCTKLAKIDIRNMTFDSMGSTYTSMFGSSASNGVPNDCLIIVKSNVEKEWITSKFSRLTNVKTVEELQG